MKLTIFSRLLICYIKKLKKLILHILTTLFILSPVRRPVKYILLTDEIVGFVAKGFKCGHLIGAHPFEWDDTTDRPKFERCSLIRRFCWICNFGLCSAHYLFLVIQCLRCQWDEETNIFFQLYSILMLWTYGILLCNHIAIVWKGNQIPAFVASYMDFIELLEYQYIREGVKSPATIKRCRKFLFAVFYGFWIFVPVFVLYHVTYPTSPDLISSVFLKSAQFSRWFPGHYTNDHELKGGLMLWTLIAVSTLVQMYIILNWLLTTFLLVFTCVPGMFTVVAVLYELSPKTRMVSKDAMEIWIIKIRIYRQLHVFAIVAQNIFGFCASYGKVIGQSVVVLCVYAILIYSGIIRVTACMIAANSFVYISTCLYAAAAVNKQAAELLAEWKAESKFAKARSNKEKFEVLTMASMQPIKLYIGKTPIDKEMIMVMYHGMAKSLKSTIMIYS